MAISHQWLNILLLTGLFTADAVTKCCADEYALFQYQVVTKNFKIFKTYLRVHSFLIRLCSLESVTLLKNKFLRRFF